MSFKDCGTCTACCEGNLVGSAYGNKFGPGPCIFLIDKKCSIYETRPQSCKNYQCAWSQGIFGDIDKPNENNMLVSVEGTNPQYLKCVKTGDVNNDNIQKLEDWASKHKTYVIYVDK